MIFPRIREMYSIIYFRVHDILSKVAIMNLKFFLETGFFLGLLANAFLFVPQALALYRLKESKSVSLITFLGFNVIQVFTAIHAYLVSDSLLLIGSILAFITCGTVTFLVFLYR